METLRTGASSYSWFSLFLGFSLGVSNSPFFTLAFEPYLAPRLLYSSSQPMPVFLNLSLINSEAALPPIELGIGLVVLAVLLAESCQP